MNLDSLILKVVTLTLKSMLQQMCPKLEVLAVLSDTVLHCSMATSQQENIAQDILIINIGGSEL